MAIPSPVVARVASTFLACDVVYHGFARIRCTARTCGSLTRTRANEHPYRRLLVSASGCEPDETVVA